MEAGQLGSNRRGLNGNRRTIRALWLQCLASLSAQYTADSVIGLHSLFHCRLFNLPSELRISE